MQYNARQLCGVGIYRMTKWAKYVKGKHSSKITTVVGSPLDSLMKIDGRGVSVSLGYEEALAAISSKGGASPYGGRGFPPSFLKHDF